MGFWGPQTCPWLKIVTNFFFLGGATELKIWDLAPRPNIGLKYFADIRLVMFLVKIDRQK